MARLSGIQLNKYDEEIRDLRLKLNRALKALEPFSTFGPDVIGMKDHQAFMGAAGIKAGHFKTAYMVYQELNGAKDNKTDELPKS